MRRIQVIVFGTALLLVGAGIIRAVDQDKPGQSTKNTPAAGEKKPQEKGSQKTSATLTNKDDAKADEGKEDNKSEDRKLSKDELDVLKTAEAYIKAYNDADAKSIAAQFTTDGEYIDGDGNVFHGRKEIEEVFKACFEGNPDGKVAMAIDSIRVVSPGVALEDGVTIVTRADGSERSVNRYSAVHVKTDDQWLVASVRDQTAREWRQHRSRLEELSWLNGDWVDDSDGSFVTFSCAPDDGGNFLIRKFSIQGAGQGPMSGEQRIGWDPSVSRFRTWIFDSEGGFSEGILYRDEDRWEMKTFGITADGQTASRTTIYTLVDENTMTWQSVDHEIDGIQLPDSDPITIVRRAPVPDSVQASDTSESK